MEYVMSKVVYISIPRKIELYKRRIVLGDIMSVWCADEHITAKIKTLALINVPDVPSRRYVYSVLDIIKMIETECQNVEVQNIGETDFVLAYKREDPQKKSISLFIRILFVCLVVFFGGAFAIMAYGNDIDVNSVLEALCMIMTGDDSFLTATQIAYSVGLSSGIIIFYDHFGRRKAKKDPSPIEVEMRLYEDDIENALIKESMRKDKEIDVD